MLNSHAFLWETHCVLCFCGKPTVCVFLWETHCGQTSAVGQRGKPSESEPFMGKHAFLMVAK